MTSHLVVFALVAAQFMAPAAAASDRAGQKRTPAGTVYTTEIPDEMVTKWDDSRLTDWLSSYSASVSPAPEKIAYYNPQNLQFRPIYGELSYYFQSTYDAVGYVESAQTQGDFDAAFYVLAKNCELYDPWACFNLATLSGQYSESIDLPAQIQFQMYRRASDADYTLATHWLVRHDHAVPLLWSVADQEAYLRRARDVDGDFAYTQLAVQLGEFYALHYPERDDAGYFDRAITLLRENGEAEFADWLVKQRR